MTKEKKLRILKKDIIQKIGIHFGSYNSIKTCDGCGKKTFRVYWIYKDTVKWLCFCEECVFSVFNFNYKDIIEGGE